MKVMSNGGFEVEVWLTQGGGMLWVCMCDGFELLGLACNGQGSGKYTEQELGDGKVTVEYVCITPWPNQFHVSNKLQVSPLRIPGFQVSCRSVSATLGCFATFLLSCFLFCYSASLLSFGSL